MNTFLALTFPLMARNTLLAASLTLTGPWTLTVALNDNHAVLTIPPQLPDVVSDEPYQSLDEFRTTGGGWTQGTRLKGIIANECTVRHALTPGTVVVRSSADAAVVYTEGQDYALVPDWGTLGRLPDSRIAENQPVVISYQYTKLRLDSVVLTAAGAIELRVGTPHAVSPAPPLLADGEVRIANIWHSATRLGVPRTALTQGDILPVLESAYPEEPASVPCPAQQLAPKSYAKLLTGEPLRILAWGDSVTACQYFPDWENLRWQNQFVTRLKKKYPQANIELVTEAWEGRNTGSYLAEPAGSIHNYAEKVLAAHADLIITEFVNDASVTEEQFQERYERILKDFQMIGAEWIPMTPHYTCPDWMGLSGESGIDDDPRPYVTFLRQFAEANRLPLADASKRYGRLWRQGIPYTTLMVNAINHPNSTGMKIFADALMALF